MAGKPTAQITLDLDPELASVLEAAATRCRTTPERIAAEAIEVSRLWLAEVRPWPRAQVEATVARMAGFLRPSLPSEAESVSDRDLPRWWQKRGRAAYLRLRRTARHQESVADLDRAIERIALLTTTGRTPIGPA